ncbi:MAG: glycerate kinase [Actinomycetota bacterium]|nr:glycerate kinase [Actinomycetota bacterium]
MHVVVAPDQFAGSLSAVQAAHAIADGWSTRSPTDTFSVLPMSDGGCGFVDVMHEALDAQLVAVTVRGPLGAATPGAVVLDGSTAYVESSQAVGGHLVAPADREPERGTSYGVGQLVTAAVDAGARRVVVGVGDGVTNDGGAGLLAALGAIADVDLDKGPEALRGITRIDLTPARARLGGVEVVLATDDPIPLLGLFGTTKAAGVQRGVSAERAPALDLLLDEYVVAATGPTPRQRRPAQAPGAGAAGGVGFALLTLGATRESGLAVVAQASGLVARARQCDLVLTGAAAYDFSSRAGSVVYGVAQIAQEALRPCVVLAEQVLVGAREMRAMGVESAYAVVDLVGEPVAPEDPAAGLRRLGQRVARTWSR